MTVSALAYAAADRIWAAHDASPANAASASPEVWWARAFTAALKVGLANGLPAREARELANEAANGAEDAL